MNPTESRLARQLPPHVGQAYHRLRWTDASLRALRGEVVQVPVRALAPHLDLAYWRRFQVTPREVLAEPQRWPRHAARIDAAELSWPLRLSRIRGHDLVLDGLHRLARAVRDGVAALPCVWVSPPHVRPMGRDDFEQLHDWLHAPHVLRWWHQPLDLETVRSKYGRRIDGQEPTQMWIIEQDEVPVAFLQSFRWADHPDHARQLGARDDEAGLDLAIGAPDRCGHGLGTSVIAAFTDRYLLEEPGIRGCLADPEAANGRSVRAFLAGGYTRSHTVGERLIVRRERATPPSR